jgi:purine-binding chemotaxis protein CheW
MKTHNTRPLTRTAAALKGATNAVSKEYLTFRLGKEEYGIDILRVQEIRSFEAPTKIANSAGFLLGVINLRDVIVPIIDLRIKFDCLDAGVNAMTVVIVLNVKGRIVGAVVDAVSDVIELSDDNIRPAPTLSVAVDTSYIIGIANVAERMLILMDITALMSSPDLGLIEDET